MSSSSSDVCQLGSSAAEIRPTAVVIFGATGDLTHRKIVPALYRMAQKGQMPEEMAIIGFARRPRTDEEFRNGLREAMAAHSSADGFNEVAWRKLAPHIYYHQGDIDDPSSYQALAKRLQELPEASRIQGNCLFYLATAPEHFGAVAENLAQAGLGAGDASGPVRRFIVEKPFGRDLESAQRLNAQLVKSFPESSICRIDHYLGKETVQNLLFLRFANSIYEPIWNRRYIEQVQITMSEEIGVEGRGDYYDKAGALRDIIQNHLLQLLALTAMEPPVSLDAEAIRDEKVKVLRAIELMSPEQVARQTVRAQYIDGMREGKPAMAYRRESRVAPDSLTETYVAMKLEIDNWRWKGVPFYLSAGKSLRGRSTEIVIVFNRPPGVLFAAACGVNLHQNTLRIHVQPDEGIHLGFNAKVPASHAIQQIDMGFHYREGFKSDLPEAYERLLIDALVGEHTLFIRSDEVEYSWRVVDRIRQAWDREGKPDMAFYPCGTMGPKEADDLLARDGRAWVRFTT
jgi:glucose-6-phosphate 1-dehydrogenase